MASHLTEPSQLKLVVFRLRREFSCIFSTVWRCLSSRRDRSSQKPLRLQIPALVYILSVLEGMRGGRISFPPSTSWQSSSIRVDSCFDIKFNLSQLRITLLLYPQSYILQMSENEEEEPQEEEVEEEEDIETKIEIDYFEVEDLLRTGKEEEALTFLDQLYVAAHQNNLKAWKVKILNHLLQIHAKSGSLELTKGVMRKICALNDVEKYNENSMKSVITVIKSLDRAIYRVCEQDVLEFVSKLDGVIQIKALLLLLEKAVETKAIEEADRLFEHIERVIAALNEVPSICYLELYSLQIKHSKFTKRNIEDRIKMMQLKMPGFDMSSGHVSVLKEAIAANMYMNGQYQSSAAYLGSAFQEKVKYGNNQVRQILKVNALVCLLIDKKELHNSDKFSMLHHESSNPFKNLQDIQALFSLIDAFEEGDLTQFDAEWQKVEFSLEESSYADIYMRLAINLKKTKLQQIIKAYKRITFRYIAQRLFLTDAQVQEIALHLILEGRIHGRIHLEGPQSFIEVLPPKNKFLNIQLENLRETSKRYL